MRCEHPDRTNPLHGTCEASAIWVVVRSRLGYPKNELVPDRPTAYCDAHAILAAASYMSEPQRYTAGVQIARVEHMESFSEVNNLRKKWIGR